MVFVQKVEEEPRRGVRRSILGTLQEDACAETPTSSGSREAMSCELEQRNVRSRTHKVGWLSETGRNDETFGNLSFITLQNISGSRVATR